MKPRHRRLAWVAGGLIALSVAATLVLNAFNRNLVFFFTPSQVIAKEAPIAHTFRIGGMVLENSLHRDGTQVRFVVTDKVHEVTVQYTGILPDLFKEGRGVVAQGRLADDGVFRADQVLAKHDENYMPPEAAEALKKGAAVNDRMSRSLVDPGTVTRP